MESCPSCGDSAESTSATEPACLHCGLPCAGASPAPDGDGPFCCLGCALLHQVETEGTDEAVGLLTRFGLSLFFAMNIMVFALIQYSGDIFPADGEGMSPIEEVFRYLQLLLATPVLLLLGQPLLENALKLGRLAAAVDLLVLCGSVAAYLASAAATFLGAGPVYFETAAGVLLFFTFGRYLDARARAEARDEVRSLLERLPEEATLLEDGEERTVPARSLEIGQRVRVRAGKLAPVDGTIVAGQAAVDRSSLTGRALPECLGVGATVRAGEVPRDGALELEVSAPWGRRVVDEVARLLARARTERAPVVLLADRLARVLLPLALVLAAITLGLGFWREQELWKTGLDALAVILIACPCALGIATPLAHFIALGEAARRGALVRSGKVLHSLARLRSVFLDKTGTLTEGRFVLRGRHGHPETLARAAALAVASEHPLSRAARVAAIAEGSAAEATVDALEVVPGRGVRAPDAAYGSSHLFDERDWPLPAPLSAAADAARARGESVAFVGWEGAARGLLCFEDAARVEAQEAVDGLRGEGLRVAILSGDATPSAEAAARAVGIDEVRAEQSPADKATLLADEPDAMFVGDGLNDGPALARAAVGVAVHSGSDLAQKTADVVLTGDLTVVPALIRLAKKTRTVVYANLIWALSFNLIGLSLAVAGRLRPLFAALAMALSSLLVVRQSLSLAGKVRREPGEPEPEPGPDPAPAAAGAAPDAGDAATP